MSCFKLPPLSPESPGGVSREGASAAADGGSGSEGPGEDLCGRPGPQSARPEAFTGVLAGALQHQPQFAQVKIPSCLRGPPSSGVCWSLRRAADMLQTGLERTERGVSPRDWPAETGSAASLGFSDESKQPGYS